MDGEVRVCIRMCNRGLRPSMHGSALSARVGRFEGDLLVQTFTLSTAEPGFKDVHEPETKERERERTGVRFVSGIHASGGQ